MRRDHVHKAEITVVRTAADAVENRGRELRAKLLIDILVEGNHLLLAVCMLDKQVNLLLRERKAQIDDVAQFPPIDRENLVPWHEPQFLRQTARRNADDFPFVHTYSSSAHIFPAAVSAAALSVYYHSTERGVMKSSLLEISYKIAGYRLSP